MHEQRRRQMEEETSRDRVSPPLGFAPQTWALAHTHTRTHMHPCRPGGGEVGASGRKPQRLQPEWGKECFPAHHLAVSPLGARGSCWKRSRARPTRCLQKPPHAPPSGAVQSAPSAGRAPRIPASPPRAALPLTRVGSPPPFPSSFFFFLSPPLPPPPVPPSSLWMRAAVDSECAAGWRQRMLLLLT